MKARDRLLLAAARAYQDALGMPPGESVEARAKWIDQAMQVEHAPDAEVTVSLRDLIEVTRAAKDVERLRLELEHERQEGDRFWQVWRRALGQFANDGRDWNARARAALRELGLLTKTKRKKDNSELVARWSALTDPNAGPPEGQRLSKRAALQLLSQETGVAPGTLKQRLYHEGVKIGVRDL
jgi:hypothetical protein